MDFNLRTTPTSLLCVFQPCFFLFPFTVSCLSSLFLCPSFKIHWCWAAVGPVPALCAFVLRGNTEAPAGLLYVWNITKGWGSKARGIIDRSLPFPQSMDLIFRPTQVSGPKTPSKRIGCTSCGVACNTRHIDPSPLGLFRIPCSVFNSFFFSPFTATLSRAGFAVEEITRTLLTLLRFPHHLALSSQLCARRRTYYAHL
jgi:hypothetical protein